MTVSLFFLFLVTRFSFYFLFLKNDHFSLFWSTQIIRFQTLLQDRCKNFRIKRRNMGFLLIKSVFYSLAK
jgi:hypothetical protein